MRAEKRFTKDSRTKILTSNKNTYVTTCHIGLALALPYQPGPTASAWPVVWTFVPFGNPVIIIMISSLLRFDKVDVVQLLDGSVER